MATPVNVSVPLLSRCVYLKVHCLPLRGSPACSIIPTLLPRNSEVSDFAACKTKGFFGTSQNKITIVMFLLTSVPGTSEYSSDFLLLMEKKEDLYALPLLVVFIFIIHFAI